MKQQTRPGKVYITTNKNILGNEYKDPANTYLVLLPGYTLLQATVGLTGRLLTYSWALGLVIKDSSCLVGVPSTSCILQI